MVFWIFHIMLLVILNDTMASKYYYKMRNGNYDIYYGPYAEWGYREFKSPKSYKVNYEDRGDRPGRCIKGEFQCDQPFPISKTKLFECEVDFQCPTYFKCCITKCFQHKICQPIIMDEEEDQETTTPETITETISELFTSESTTPQVIHSTVTESSNTSEYIPIVTSTTSNRVTSNETKSFETSTTSIFYSTEPISTQSSSSVETSPTTEIITETEASTSDTTTKTSIPTNITYSTVPIETQTTSILKTSSIHNPTTSTSITTSNPPATSSTIPVTSKTSTLVTKSTVMNTESSSFGPTLPVTTQSSITPVTTSKPTTVFPTSTSSNSTLRTSPFRTSTTIDGRTDEVLSTKATTKDSESTTTPPTSSTLSITTQFSSSPRTTSSTEISEITTMPITHSSVPFTTHTSGSPETSSGETSPTTEHRTETTVTTQSSNILITTLGYTSTTIKDIGTDVAISDKTKQSSQPTIFTSQSSSTLEPSSIEITTKSTVGNESILTSVKTTETAESTTLSSPNSIVTDPMHSSSTFETNSTVVEDGTETSLTTSLTLQTEKSVPTPEVENLVKSTLTSSTSSTTGISTLSTLTPTQQDSITSTLKPTVASSISTLPISELTIVPDIGTESVMTSVKSTEDAESTTLSVYSTVTDSTHSRNNLKTMSAIVEDGTATNRTTSLTHQTEKSIPTREVENLVKSTLTPSISSTTGISTLITLTPTEQDSITSTLKPTVASSIFTLPISELTIVPDVGSESVMTSVKSSEDLESTTLSSAYSTVPDSTHSRSTLKTTSAIVEDGTATNRTTSLTLQTEKSVPTPEVENLVKSTLTPSTSSTTGISTLITLTPTEQDSITSTLKPTVASSISTLPISELTIVPDVATESVMTSVKSSEDLEPTTLSSAYSTVPDSTHSRSTLKTKSAIVEDGTATNRTTSLIQQTEESVPTHEVENLIKSTLTPSISSTKGISTLSTLTPTQQDSITSILKPTVASSISTLPIPELSIVADVGTDSVMTSVKSIEDAESTTLSSAYSTVTDSTHSRSTLKTTSAGVEDRTETNRTTSLTQQTEKSLPTPEVKNLVKSTITSSISSTTGISTLSSLTRTQEISTTTTIKPIIASSNSTLPILKLTTVPDVSSTKVTDRATKEITTITSEMLETQEPKGTEISIAETSFSESTTGSVDIAGTSRSSKISESQSTTLSIKSETTGSITSEFSKPTIRNSPLTDLSTKSESQSSTTETYTERTTEEYYTTVASTPSITLTNSFSESTTQTFSSTSERRSTHMSEVTSDDEDLTFSGDNELTTDELQSSTLVDGKITTVETTSLATSANTLPEQINTSNEISSTVLTTIYMKPTKPAEETTAQLSSESSSKSPTPLTSTTIAFDESTLIGSETTSSTLFKVTDDEDLSFSGDGDLYSTTDEHLSSFSQTVIVDSSTSTSSHVIEDTSSTDNLEGITSLSSKETTLLLKTTQAGVTDRTNSPSSHVTQAKSSFDKLEITTSHSSKGTTLFETPVPDISYTTNTGNDVGSSTTKSSERITSSPLEFITDDEDLSFIGDGESWDIDNLAPNIPSLNTLSTEISWDIDNLVPNIPSLNALSTEIRDNDNKLSSITTKTADRPKDTVAEKLNITTQKYSTFYPQSTTNVNFDETSKETSNYFSQSTNLNTKTTIMEIFTKALTPNTDANDSEGTTINQLSTSSIDNTDGTTTSPMLLEYPFNENVVVIENMLGTLQKLPTTYLTANYSEDRVFNSFFGLLNSVSNLLGKLNDIKNDRLEFETSTSKYQDTTDVQTTKNTNSIEIVTKRNLNYNTGSLKEKTSAKRIIVEVEN